VLSVVELLEDDPTYHGRALFHGRILHGYQLFEKEKRSQPTAYFHEGSGIGLLMRNYPRRPRRIGIIGLGAGAIASYAEPGDVVRYYEINPLVIEYARTYFTFLEDCKAKTVEIVPGDARIAMEAETPQEYDLLVIDAFSGDAIPTHLLTREAMELYQRHLRPDGRGTLAFHISNRYLELRPVVAALAEAAECRSLLVTESTSDFHRITPSDWAIVTRDPNVLNLPALRSVARPLLMEGEASILWTDRQSNLLGVLR
jgi:hypothetical protein